MTRRRVTTPSPTRRAWRARAAAVTGAAALATALLAPAAVADDPFRLDSHVTDTTSDAVLAGSTDEIEAATRELADSTRYDLFVVYVDSFDGMDADAWGDATATASQLGDDDALLAVAVTDRVYTFSLGTGAPLTDDQLDTIRTEQIEPALADDDWAGAAVAAAEGLQDAAGGGTGAGGGGGGSSAGWILVGILVIAAAVALVVWLVRRRGRRAAEAGPGAAPGSLESLSTEELNQRASAGLVAIDDGLRTYEQELGFAEAQFGTDATASFAAALADAKPRVARAFELRQQLDDSTPEAEPQARAMMAEIITTLEQVQSALGGEAQRFVELREEQRNAPATLDALDARIADLAARVPAARETLANLAVTYPASALASVAANPDQAQRLLDGARTAVAQGRDAVARQDGAASLEQIRVATGATSQAATLLDGVSGAGADLAEAGPRLEAAIASITADVADAQRLAAGQQGVAGAVAEATTATEQARAATSGGDPLAALTRIAGAEAALDAALAPFREQEEVTRRAAAQLDGMLGRLESQVRATNDFVSTRRGAVGPEARTRLAEAIRLLTQAREESAADPATALATAQRAQQYATSAQDLAQRDVESWDRSQQVPQQSSSGPDIGSMILGGILFGNRGGSGGGWGGGFTGGGGSGWGGSGRSGSSRRSGGSSFGGSRRSSGGSRRSSGGRRSGGGRF